jgi:hypothetical protein
MANDSHLFRTAKQLAAIGARRDGRDWVTASGERYVPLYEGKMFTLYTHRYGTFENIVVRPPPGASIPHPEESRQGDPDYEVEPWYWIGNSDVAKLPDLSGKQWFFAFRDVTNTTAERTFVGTILPRSAVNHKAPLLLSSREANLFIGLIANMSSLVLDFVARQKVSGSSMTYFYVKQFPVLPPSFYTAEDLAFIVPRVVELTYTSHCLSPFARDLGYHGRPFAWNEDRRALLRAELDAFYALAYGLTRDELRYILDPADVMGPDYPSETFRVLKDNEMMRYREYRTRRLVLEAWDRQIGNRSAA